MASEPVVSACVYQKDKDGVLQPLDGKTSEAILAAAAKGQRYVRMGCGLVFDLKIMKRLERGQLEDEEILIEIPWNAKSLRAANSLKEGDTVRRKILEMAIDHIVTEQFLNKILDLKTMPARSVRKNPHLGRGHLPYDTFVDSLLAATLSTESRHSGSSGEKLYDAIMEIASDAPTKARVRLLGDEGLRLAFHGTNEALMDDILQTGLLPEFRRSGDCEWFGIKYTVSMKYSESKTRGRKATKVLFFMVLDGQRDADYITSGSNRFQLPVAEITLTLTYRNKVQYGIE